MALDASATRERVANSAAAMGWKLRSLKKRPDGYYIAELYEKRMYQEPSGRELTVTGPLDTIYASVGAELWRTNFPDEQ